VRDRLDHDIKFIPWLVVDNKELDKLELGERGELGEGEEDEEEELPW